MARNIGTLTGLGELLDGTQSIAQVRYHISLWQEELDASNLAGTSTVPGIKSANGNIHAISGATLVELGHTYTLRLADGRQCSVFPKRVVDLLNGDYELAFANIGDLAAG